MELGGSPMECRYTQELFFSWKFVRVFRAEDDFSSNVSLDRAMALRAGGHSLICGEGGINVPPYRVPPATYLRLAETYTDHYVAARP